MNRIKVGTKFLYKKSGSHSPYEMIVLNDPRKNRRFIYCISLGFKVWETSILYGFNFTQADKKETKYYTESYIQRFKL